METNIINKIKREKMKTEITKEQYNALRYKLMTKLNSFKINTFFFILLLLKLFYILSFNFDTILIVFSIWISWSLLLTGISMFFLDVLVRDGKKNYEEIKELLGLEKDLPV